MDIERDQVQDPGVIISSIIDTVSDLVIQLSEDLGDGALEIADKGEYTYILKLSSKYKCSY